MKNGEERKFQGSVKIMRSYDYCHFEAALSSDEDMTLDEINEMRKQAALLVDEAVRQYKQAKSAEGRREQKEWEKERALKIIAAAKEKPESELTAEEAALLRADADQSFWRDFESDDYYYSDGDRDHHFSMLRKFQETVVKAT